jgi:hypothetical protein
MPSLYPFFEWCQNGPLGQLVASRELLFPGLETFHLFGLTLLLGTVLLLSLRLLGVMLVRQPVSELATDLQPYTTWGLVLILTSGLFMFIGVAIKCYGATSFWIKMALLAVGLIFHFTYFRKAVRRDDLSPRAAKLAAWSAIIVWFGVASAGRSIGFFG